MTTIKQAIILYAACEKLKANLIWLAGLLEGIAPYPKPALPPSEKLLQDHLRRIAYDLHTLLESTGSPRLKKAQSHMETAMVMMDSGVSYESVYHTTRALSQITSVGQEAMEQLKDKGLLE